MFLLLFFQSNLNSIKENLVDYHATVNLECSQFIAIKACCCSSVLPYQLFRQIWGLVFNSEEAFSFGYDANFESSTLEFGHDWFGSNLLRVIKMNYPKYPSIMMQSSSLVCILFLVTLKTEEKPVYPS